MRYLIMQGNVNDNTQWNEWINAVWIIFTFIDIEFLINDVSLEINDDEKVLVSISENLFRKKERKKRKTILQRVVITS